MKLVCSQTELNTSLALVGRAVSARPAHPILANVLLIADAGTGQLSLTGFDLNLGIQTSIPATVETSGAITLPARLFGDIVSRLATDSPVTLSCDAAGVQVELTSMSSSYQINGMTADDYPELPLSHKTTPAVINADQLLRGLRSTVFAASNDESKQILTGVHLTLNGALECAATDGHRLSVSTVLGTDADQGFEVTIPAKSLRELERLLAGAKDQDVELFSDQGQVVVTAGQQILTTRSLDGTYPKYQQLVPEKFERKVTVNRKALIAGLERVSILADQHSNVVKFSSEPKLGQVVLQADAQDVGSGLECIAAEISGDATKIAFNSRYLIDGLKVISSEDVILQCNAPSTPAVLRSADDSSEYLYLVMPVQVRA